jgi:pyroglutamyl-peptidase
MKRAQPQAKQAKQLKVSKSSTPLSCLITGFDAFEAHPFNPSEVVVRSIPEKLLLGHRKTIIPIQRTVLPTIGNKAWTLMRSALRKIDATNKPCVIIMLGLASKRKEITLERFSLNIRDALIKDNAGHSYSGQTIDKKAPAALRTNAPLEKIRKYLKSKRINVEISNFCGSFVCNEIYFRTLNQFKKSRMPHLIMFIHLPLPSARRKKSSQLSRMRSAIIKAAEFSCTLVLRQREIK